jgi:zinc transporter 1/2/3
MGLGTQEDVSSLLSVAAAITCHKGFASFAMGCALIKVGNRKAYITLCIVFCLASPIGMVLGIFVQMAAPDGPAPALLNGFCGGTLLFVATDEIIAPALASEETALWKKALALWVGFGAMAAMAIWT